MEVFRYFSLWILKMEGKENSWISMPFADLQLFIFIRNHGIWDMGWDDGIKKWLGRTHAKMEVIKKIGYLFCVVSKDHRRLGCPPILSAWMVKLGTSTMKSSIDIGMLWFFFGYLICHRFSSSYPYIIQAWVMASASACLHAVQAPTWTMKVRGCGVPGLAKAVSSSSATHRVPWHSCENPRGGSKQHRPAEGWCKNGATS